MPASSLRLITRGRGGFVSIQMDLYGSSEGDGFPRGDEVRRVLREASEGSGVPDAGGGFQRGLGPRGVIWKNRERGVGEESGGAMALPSVGLRPPFGKRHPDVLIIRCQYNLFPSVEHHLLLKVLHFRVDKRYLVVLCYPNYYIRGWGSTFLSLSLSLSKTLLHALSSMPSFFVR